MCYRKEMHLLSRLILVLSCLFTLSQTQAYRRYPDQRISAVSYRAPSASSSSYYNSASNPSLSDSNHKHSFQRNVYPYGGSTGPYSSYKQPASAEASSSPYSAAKWQSVNRIPISSVSSFHPSYTSPANKQYSSNLFNADNSKNDVSSDLTVAKNNRVSKADSENAKFAGAANQENDVDGRTAFLKRKIFRRRFGGSLINPCFPYGRDAGNNITPPPKLEGRFLWDVNVYNVYPQASVGLGCGHHGGGFGGGLGSGLLSDPISPGYYSPGTGIANFLSLFAPGILQNSLAATARPQQFADYDQLTTDNYLQSDPEVDPNYRPEQAPVPVRRPNRVFYDSAGAPPVTPGQLLGGVSTTVNGIIQQLTGNVQPVYG